MNQWKMGWVPVIDYPSRVGKEVKFISPGSQPLQLKEDVGDREPLFYLQVPISQTNYIFNDKFVDLTSFPTIYAYPISVYDFREQYLEVTRGKLIHKNLIYWEKPMCDLCMEQLCNY